MTDPTSTLIEKISKLGKIIGDDQDSEDEIYADGYNDGVSDAVAMLREAQPSEICVGIDIARFDKALTDYEVECIRYGANPKSTDDLQAARKRVMKYVTEQKREYSNEEPRGITIGGFALSKWDEYPDKIWISAEDGEGGQFNESDLKGVLEAFYKENF